MARPHRFLLAGLGGWLAATAVPARGQPVREALRPVIVTTTGTVVEAPSGAPGSEFSSVVSRDRALRARGAPDGRVIVTRTDGDSVVAILAGHRGAVAAVAFLRPDGSLLASGGADGTIRVWDVRGRRQLTRVPAADAGPPVRGLVAADDGRALVVVRADATVHVFVPPPGPSIPFASWTASGSPTGIGISPDAAWVVTVDATGAVERRPILDSVFVGRDPALAARLAPQDPFETDVAFQIRVADGLRLVRALERSADRAAALERVATGQRDADASERRVLESRRVITLPRQRVRMQGYDPSARRWTVVVDGRSYPIAMAPEDARTLAPRADSLVVEAVEQLGADLRSTELVNLELIHPTSGRRYPIGRQIALRTAATVPLGPVSAPPALRLDSLRFTDADGDDRLGVGEPGLLQFRLRNEGRGPARGVRVVGTSSQPMQGLRATLGDLGVGEARTVALTVVVPSSARDGETEVALEIREGNGFHAGPARVRLPVRGFRPPQLVVGDVAVEDPQGRAVVRPGQLTSVTVRVQNIGGGRAQRVSAELVAGPGVFFADSAASRRLVRGIGDLEVGAYRDVRVDAFANLETMGRFPIQVVLREATGRYGTTPRDLGLRTETPLRSVAELEVRGRAGAPSSTPSRATPSLLSAVPVATQPNPDAVAVIIGNRNYRQAPAVAFASNDAAVMRVYAERTLGIRPGNIIVLDDATLTDLKVLFGDQGNPAGRLKDLVKSGRSDIFVFYSGHGAPDPASQRSYLMPADADANRLALSGFPVDVLYDNLSRLGARHVTVVLDACFSGATGGGEMLITAASPIGIVVKDPAARFASGATIITAASGQQLASWFPEQRHGLLTYFFLRGLQGEADADADGRVTVGEMRHWLTDPSNAVPYEARRLFGREQTPQVWGAGDRILR